MIYKGQMYIRIIAGAGLIYEGMKLIQEPISEGVENYIGYTICGVVFVLIGAFLLIRNLIRMLKKDYIDPLAASKKEEDQLEKEWNEDNESEMIEGEIENDEVCQVEDEK